MADRAVIMIRIDADFKRRVRVALARDEYNMTEIILAYLANYCEDSEGVERERQEDAAT